MTPGKRFLLILFAVAMIGWAAGNYLMGPPGFTSEYREANKHDHERYLQITKSDPYKRYAERPHLHGPDAPDAPPTLAAEIAFVAEYTGRADYQAERRRQQWYELYFDFFNSGLVVALALYFGRRPLLGYIDGQIQAIRDRIDKAAHMRHEAEALTRTVQEQVRALPDEEHRIALETERRIEKELSELAEANHYSLGLMERELVDRKEQQWLNAKRRMQREMVLQAVDGLKEQFAEAQPDAFHDDLVDEFADFLEQRHG